MQRRLWRSFVMRLAHLAGRASRALGRGQGVVITGRVLTALSPGSVEELARGRRVVLVSGTNGKSTTARMLVEAWTAQGAVTTNSDGANLLSGVVHALLSSAHERVVLEVDELVLPSMIQRLQPEAVVLLNLSRDQLDRVGEIAEHVRGWRTALRDYPGSVVANADDPLVVAAVPDGVHAVWVGAGLAWHEDARLCQRCGRPVVVDVGGWRCTACSHARPPVALSRQGSVIGGRAVELGLPGEGNLCNAAMAMGAAVALHLDLDRSVEALTRVREVVGRYAQADLAGHPIELMLMKNPASAGDVLELVTRRERPIVLLLNAEAADGRDPSWLWDVPFGRLAGRTVVVAGRRAADLSVRLAYAGVEHTLAADLDAALRTLPAGRCDVVANYTAFAAVRTRLAC